MAPAAGIGAAIAQRLHDAGYTLSLGARDPATLPIGESARVMHGRFDAVDKPSHMAWSRRP
ncbi:MAG: hypothetical protein R3D03_11210 [Geminicoccaceae bacterium]